MLTENGSNIIPLDTNNIENTNLIKENRFKAGKKEYDLVNCNILYITNSEEIGIKSGDEIITFKIVDGEILERNNRGYNKSRNLIILGDKIIFIGEKFSEIKGYKKDDKDSSIENSNQRYFDEGDDSEADEIYNKEIIDTIESETKIAYDGVMENLDSLNELDMENAKKWIIKYVNEIGVDGLSKKIVGNTEGIISNFTDKEKSIYLNKIYEIVSIQVDEIIEIGDTLNETEIEKYEDLKSELKLEIKEVQNNDLYFGL